MPDWEFIEWNEENSDLSKSLFAQRMLKERKYAFVSDYSRLKALYEIGGIYLDTDVMVYKSFEPLLDHDMFVGFMLDNVIGTAIIGSCIKNPNIYNLLQKYENGEINEPIVNNFIFTDYFVERYNDFLLNNKLQELEKNVYIYPKEVFEFPCFKRKKPYSRHLYEGSWKQSKKKNILKLLIRKVIGDPIYFRINHDFILVKRQKYYSKYINDKKIK